MSSRYTMADVLRWKKMDEGRLPSKLAQLHDSSFHGRRDFVLSGLHLLHEGLGYTYVALDDPKIASNHFLTSCQYVEQLFSLPERGEVVAPGRLSAGYCTSWLVALAIGADATAASLASKFKQEHLSARSGHSEIEQIALSLQALMSNRDEDARDILSCRPAATSNDFQHYLECLGAIAERQEERFVGALDRAAERWSIQITRTHRGLPQSVCFIHGLGILRLAEQVLGRPMQCSNIMIPSTFFPRDKQGAA